MKISKIPIAMAAGLVLAFGLSACNEGTKEKPVSQQAANAPAPSPAAPAPESGAAPSPAAPAPAASASSVSP